MPTWLDSIFNFLNENSGAITVFTTIVLAGITFWYVLVTKDILKATNKPEVILFLRPNEREINLCVQNIGAGYASNIKFTGDLSFKPNRNAGFIVDDSDSKPLEELEPFKSGINYLGTGHKIETFLCYSGRSQLEDSFTINLVYEDSAHIKYMKSFSFEPGNWKNTSQFITPQKDEVANALGQISNILEQVRDDNMEKINALERIADALEQESSDE